MTLSVRSLTTRVVTVAVIVGLVAGAFGLLVIRATTRDALRSQEEDERATAARQLAAAVDARVDRLRETARLLSNRPPVTALDPSGADLAAALDAGADFDILAVTDTSGAPVAAAARTEGADLASLPPRPEVIGELKPGETFVDLTGTSPLVRVVSAVENPPGTVVGALVGWAPTQVLARDVSSRLLGRSAAAFVTAPDGAVLAREREDVAPPKRYPIDAVRDGDDDVEVIERDGRPVVAAAAEATQLPLLVVVEQETSEAFARVGRQVGGLTLVAALILTAVLLAALVAVPRLLRPFHELARTVRSLHEGDRSVRAQVGGSTEVRAVASEVNRMAEALDRRFRELDDAQRELAETEDRFRGAFDQAPVAMALVGGDGAYQQVNPAMCVLLGRTEAELVGLSWRDVTHPDDVGTSAIALDAARRSGNRSYHLEKRYLHQDGHAVWTLTSVALVRAGEAADSMVVHVQDITAQRRSLEDREALLHHAVAAEERANRILEGAPDATLVVVSGGQIAYANRRVAELFGYEPADLIGEGVETLLPERFRERHTGHRRGYADSARPMGAGLSLWGRRSDGSEFPVEVSLSPLNIEGETQVVASVRDVTERRRAEDTSRALDAMRTRQRQAVELNDNIVQGLTVAKWAFESERLADARRAVEQTLEAARTLIQDMLREASAVELMPGDLVRQRPAEFS